MRQIEQRARETYRTRFAAEPEVVCSAPGRINLLGEHTDYNGGFVLPCAVDYRVAIALGPGSGGLYSIDYDEIRPQTSERTGIWSDYPSGVAWALSEAGWSVPACQAVFVGDVPRGAGLSSSAAIEAATILALDTLSRWGLSRTTLAQLCQRAENAFVGVPSGIMDQYASLLCQAGSALLLDCRSLVAESVPLDLASAGLCLVICDTRVKRRLGQTGYQDRRATCECAARLLGVDQLRDATADDLARLSGEELLRARHVVTENARVLAGVDALRQGDFEAFGRLMYASHASLRDDYAVSTPELDTFVVLAQDMGALGARLTGAGFGGCAIALLERTRLDALVETVTHEYAAHGFIAPGWYAVSPSDGAEVAQ